jgi:Gamma-glutamyl cyclotransferase, AIG2-like
MRFFFYGSLLDPAIRRAVMGRWAARCRIVPAELDGWRRCRYRRTIYPVLLRKPGAAVRGCLIEDVAAEAASRLAAFEGPAYRVARISARLTGGGVADACVFLPSRRLAGAESWNLSEWSRGRQRRALRLAQAQMARHGRLALRERLTGWRRRERRQGNRI